MTTPIPCTCGASFGHPCVCELRERLYTAGRLIGTTPPGIRFYLLDGAVYCVCSHTQVDYSGTLAEFVDRDERRERHGEPRLLRQFFAYDAKQLAIDPARPWQVCSDFGILQGQYATAAEARAEAGRLIRKKLLG